MKEYIKTENARDKLIHLSVANAMDHLSLEDMLTPDRVVEYANNNLTAQQRQAFGVYGITKITVEDVVDVYGLEEIAQAIRKLTDARLITNLNHRIISDETSIKDKSLAREILKDIQEKNAVRQNSHIHVLYMPPNDVTKYDMELYGVWDDFVYHSQAIKDLQQRVWDEKLKGSK